MATGMAPPHMGTPTMPGMSSTSTMMPGMSSTSTMMPGSTTTMKGGNYKMMGGMHGKMMGGRRTKKSKKGLKLFGYKVPFLGGGKMPTVGSKASVFHGKAKHTSGGLTRKDLMKTKNGRIVSRKKHALGKKALKNLVKAGYKAKKGTFKLFRK